MRLQNGVKMTKFLSVAFAMLVWGNLSFAATTTASVERNELQTISSWMAHLNFHYPNLDAAAAEKLNTAADRREALHELQILEDILQGQTQVPDGSLKLLACGRPACDGGGGGGTCRVCNTEE